MVWSGIGNKKKRGRVESSKRREGGRKEGEGEFRGQIACANGQFGYVECTQPGISLRARARAMASRNSFGSNLTGIRFQQDHIPEYPREF